MARILVFGGTGMLGHKLVQVLSPTFETWAAIRRPFGEVADHRIFERSHTIDRLDITDHAEVEKAIEKIGPDIVINAVGVIKQSPTFSDSSQTLLVNAVFPRRLASLSALNGFRLITIGTDCVFDGRKGNYTETDIADASDFYGLSKLLGEIENGNVLTVRTSIIGRELVSKKSLVEWFLCKTGTAVSGYTNAIYSGFPTCYFARIISQIIQEHPNLRGIYHVSSNPISKFDLLKLLNKHYRADVDIIPDDQVMIDRSLDSTRFRLETGFVPEEWDRMIEQMAAEG